MKFCSWLVQPKLAWLLLFAQAALLCMLAQSARADALDDIKARGKLLVGVKKDVLLWGYLNPKTSRIEGMEPDLAYDLGRRFGVPVELIGLVTAERITALEERRVDVLIATLPDTPERRARLTLIEPHYYSSGVNIVARKVESFKKWTDLRNRRVCSRRDDFYNRPVSLEYGADVIALYGNDLAMAALRDGRCSAFLYDDTAISAMLIDPSWNSQFEMPLSTLYPTPWSVALPPGEFGSKIESLVSSAIIDWHRTGLLKQLEKKWGIPQSAYVTNMNSLWSKKVDSVWYCGTELGAKTPKECR